MKFRLLFFLSASLLFSCSGNKYKSLDLKKFSVSIPESWQYIKQNDDFSFVGEISTGKTSLLFDYSDIGNTSFGPETEREYLDSKKWLNDCQYCDKKIVDSVQVVKIHSTNEEEKLKFGKAQYIAEVKYRGDILNVPITIPSKISKVDSSIDTNANYIVKMAWPKEGNDGETGLYIKSLKSPLSFSLEGRDLSIQDQKEALKAFKTLKLN
ncbi:hypothetical protein [Pedobacter sp. B4-66]|uniref:hypothetical protein n=1 Tax=Pedobacter sp. B4-66 TaxID=2817280 RepID=UPI001BD9A410|nr:hypothetical protein [Pedobacter sp. B4-66]